MIFYNGFNLMIDLIIIGLALWATKRAWLRGYGAGQYDLNEYYDQAGQYYLDQEREGE